MKCEKCGHERHPNDYAPPGCVPDAAIHTGDFDRQVCCRMRRSSRRRRVTARDWIKRLPPRGYSASYAAQRPGVLR